MALSAPVSQLMLRVVKPPQLVEAWHHCIAAGSVVFATRRKLPAASAPTAHDSGGENARAAWTCCGADAELGAAWASGVATAIAIGRLELAVPATAASVTECTWAARSSAVHVRLQLRR